MFQRIDGTKVDLESYIRTYIESRPNVEIWIGCDSQIYGVETCYAVVVALYTPGKGAHVIYNKWRSKEKVRTMRVRLVREAWSAMETAEQIQSYGLPKPKYIDLDINPDPKYRSNEVLSQVVGMCEGMGYSVRVKSSGPLVTSMADAIVRRG